MITLEALASLSRNPPPMFTFLKIGSILAKKLDLSWFHRPESRNLIPRLTFR